MRKLLVLAAACAGLGACTGHAQDRRAGVQVRPLVDPGEAVWHLRVGLNVAALMCKGRGRAGVTGDYSRLLGRHRSLLASAYAAEQRRHGSGFERHQTRIYNRFANQRDPVAFCHRASGVAKRALVLDSPGLARAAGNLVSEID